MWCISKMSKALHSKYIENSDRNVSYLPCPYFFIWEQIFYLSLKLLINYPNNQ
jgi:hypothetical protein